MATEFIGVIRVGVEVGIDVSAGVGAELGIDVGVEVGINIGADIRIEVSAEVGMATLREIGRTGLVVRCFEGFKVGVGSAGAGAETIGVVKVGVEVLREVNIKVKMTTVKEIRRLRLV
jgi:hypothetical protein